MNSTDGEVKKSNIAGLMYADDVCLYVESAKSVIM